MFYLTVRVFSTEQHWVVAVTDYNQPMASHRKQLTERALGYVQRHRGDCSTLCRQSIRSNGSEYEADLAESFLVEEELSQAGAHALQVGHVLRQLFDGFYLLGQVVTLNEIAHLRIVV